MKAVFHLKEGSDKYLRDFAEKRLEFALREIRELPANDLKALLCALKEDNRTFEQTAALSYN